MKFGMVYVHIVHQPPSKSLQNILLRAVHIRLIWQRTERETWHKSKLLLHIITKHLAERKQHANATLAVNESIVVAYRGFHVIRSVFYSKNFKFGKLENALLVNGCIILGLGYQFSIRVFLICVGLQCGNFNRVLVVTNLCLINLSWRVQYACDSFTLV